MAAWVALNSASRSTLRSGAELELGDPRERAGAELQASLSASPGHGGSAIPGSAVPGRSGRAWLFLPILFDGRRSRVLKLFGHLLELSVDGMGLGIPRSLIALILQASLRTGRLGRHFPGVIEQLPL